MSGDVSNSGRTYRAHDIDAHAAMTEEASKQMATRIIADIQHGAGTDANGAAHKDLSDVVQELTVLNDPLSAARVQRKLCALGFPEIRVESADDGGTVTSDIVAFSPTGKKGEMNRAVWLAQRSPGRGKADYTFDDSDNVPVEAMWQEEAQNKWSE
jgi:hypothetical protein